jgi:3-oxoadipate CoA-transferase alpha subunit
MVNKIVGSLEEAVTDIRDGSVICIGGFGYAGTPFCLIRALAERTPTPGELTLVGVATRQVDYLVAAGSVKKVITTYPGFPTYLRSLIDPKDPLIQAYKRGEVEVEVVAQGNMVERLRAAGAGIPAFYTPIGVGTELGEGKETRSFDGAECMLEKALKADYALIKAHKADRYGNLVYRGTARGHNPIYAMAADTTIVEVDEMVDVGELAPEAVVTPGIFVDCVVKAPKTEPYQYFRDFFYEEMKDYLEYAHAKRRS